MSTKPGYREFTAIRDDKSTIQLSVRKPTRRELEYADLEYSAKFNLAICNGIPTQTKLLRNLRENEVIDKKTEALLGQLGTDARALEKQLAKKNSFPTAEERTAAQSKLDGLLKQLQEVNSEVDSFFEHVAETKASSAQRNFLIACVVEVQDVGDNKGKRLWEGVDNLLDEQDGALINRIVYEYMMCIKDMPSEWDKLIAAEQPDANDSEPTTETPVVPPAAAPPVEIAA